MSQFESSKRLNVILKTFEIKIQIGEYLKRIKCNFSYKNKINLKKQIKKKKEKKKRERNGADFAADSAPSLHCVCGIGKQFNMIKLACD